MKMTLWSVLVFLFFSAISPGQTQSQNQQVPAPTAYAVSERGPNHKIWERTVYEQTPWGPAPKIHRYREIATGMHFLRNGQYIETSEQIQILPGGIGAAATNGPHQVYFPSDIYDGAITIIGPDGRTQQSRPWGIAYFDGTTNALISELQHSTGQLLPSGNQIIYTNCFTDFHADILATYRKNGLECDLIFREKPPIPAVFNLSDNCRLQLLTELLNTQDPAQKLLPADPADGLADAEMSFGALKMIKGRTFLTGPQTPNGSRLRPGAGVPVYKSIEKIPDNGTNRTFLIEEVPYRNIKSQLDSLAVVSPKSRALLASADGIRFRVSKSRLLSPARPIQRNSTKPIQLAKSDLARKPGLTLDYVEVGGSTNDYTFLGDTTYYVSSPFYVHNATLEPGTVLKFGDPDGSIGCSGACYSQSQPYLPAVLTSPNDNSVGEAFGTGTPVREGAYYLSLDVVTNSLSHLRIMYAGVGIYVDRSGLQLSDCQFVNCEWAMDTGARQPMSLENVLFSKCSVAVAQDTHQGIAVQAEHVTADQVGEFVYSGHPTNSFANCIFTGLGSPLPSPGTNNNVISLATNTGVFQTVGGGSYYLADGSPYRNIGTNNLSTNMLARLLQTTTFPPLVYSDVVISNDLTIGPQAQRDISSSPALGYHYDPLDYAFGGVDAYANLTFQPGTAVGWFRTSSGWYHAGHGIHLDDLKQINFNGTFEAPDYWVRCSTAQEGGTGQWDGGYGPGGITGWTTSSLSDAPVIIARFTHCCQFVGEAMHFRDDNGFLTVKLKDCELYNGGVGGYSSDLALTNCLFHRVSVWISYGSGGQTWIWRNCTIKGQAFTLDRSGAGGYTYVSIRDCAFDGTTLSTADTYATNPTYTDFNFNAFITNTSYTYPSGSNDVYVTDFNWQVGPLGSWYLPSDSTLIDAGSFTNSALAGEYHYTTQTNQTPEANFPLDIGLHRIALDVNGSANDADADGIPDYLEDPNGNGAVDSGETDWQSASDLGLKVIITRPKNNSIIP